MIWNFLPHEEEHDIPSQKSEDHFRLHVSVSFRPQYVWFLVHLYVGLIPNSSGQLADLIVYMIPLE